MRIYVTGGTGFIGAHFLKVALSARIEVIALRRLGSSPSIELTQVPEWAEGDLEKPNLDALHDCHTLVHFAAAGVDPRCASWEECFSINLTASLNLFRDAIEKGVQHLVICGSCFEYGKSGERFDFIPISAPLEPIGPYASSKAAASVAAIGLAQERGVKLTILRPFHVFGEGESSNRFWPSLRCAALAGKDFPMTAGEQIRDFVPVEDVAMAFLNAVIPNQTDKTSVISIHNVGSGLPQTLLEFANRWWIYWGATGSLIPGAVPYRLREYLRLVPQISIR